MKISNYFLSGWMANLGVVPLFSFAAFLLAPLFLILFFLLLEVTAVLDDIKKSFKYLVNFNSSYLSFCLYVVKIFMVMLCAIPSLQATETISAQFFLSKGEILEILVPEMQNLSVGNKEVISHKWLPESKKILIKGLSIGYSDLLVWNKKGKTQYKIYVLSKVEHLKKMQVAQTLNETGLTITAHGPIIKAQGIVTTLFNYHLIHQLYQKHKEILHLELELAGQVRNEIIADIYDKILESEAEFINCSDDGIFINCHYFGLNPKHPLLKALEEKYHVIFNHYTPHEFLQNYQLRFKIVQIEHFNGQENSLGLHNISAKVSDFLNKTPLALIQDNQIQFSAKIGKYYTLAEPETLITLDEPSAIQVGGEIPFQRVGGNNATYTEWKFAGLKINAKLTQKGSKLQLDYESEFTKPDENGVSGSKEKGTIFIDYNTYMKIFEVGHKVSARQESGLPFINKIPILKNIFGATSTQTTFKQIIGFVYLTKKGK
jgi:hypothetical protein